MAGSSMRDIKRRIRSVTSIEHITNAMNLVSAAKLRRAKNIFEKTQGYLHYITEDINELICNAEEIPGRYLLGEREIKRTCYVIVTGNRGLAGSYNTNIIKAAEREIESDSEKGRDDPLLVCIGGKGLSYFSKRGYEVFSEYTGPPESVSFIVTSGIAKPVIALYDNNEIDEVVIVFTSFETTITQRAVCKRLLPFEPPEEKEEHKRKRHIEYEPGPEEVFSYLVPKYAEIVMYQAVVEASTCEHAARRAAMQNATDNANEMIGNLELSFNRARQAAITNEISEIVSGADAIK